MSRAKVVLPDQDGPVIKIVGLTTFPVRALIVAISEEASGILLLIVPFIPSI